MTTYTFIDIRQVLEDGNIIGFIDNSYNTAKNIVNKINTSFQNVYGCKLSIFDDKTNIEGCKNYQISSDTDCDRIVNNVFGLSLPIVHRNVMSSTGVKSVIDPINASYRNCFNININRNIVNIYPQFNKTYLIFEFCLSGNEQTFDYLVDSESFNVQTIVVDGNPDPFPSDYGNTFDYVLVAYTDMVDRQQSLYNLYFQKLGSFDNFLVQLNKVKNMNCYLVACFHGMNKGKIFYCNML
jgi:hypothetical protein